MLLISATYSFTTLHWTYDTLDAELALKRAINRRKLRIHGEPKNRAIANALIRDEVLDFVVLCTGSYNIPRQFVE